MEKSSLRDEELWQKIVAGDNRAFSIFYDRYWLRMYKAAIYYLKDSNGAEEVVQEVFLQIWTKKETLEIHNFTAYLNSSTRYEVFRRIKVAKRSLLISQKEIAEVITVYNEGDYRLNEIDNINLLNDCLKHLPNRCREIFYLSKDQQLTNKEISEKLGISKHTVENQLAIALKHVKVNLSRIAILLLLIIKLGIILEISTISNSNHPLKICYRNYKGRC